MRASRFWVLAALTTGWVILLSGCFVEDKTERRAEKAYNYFTDGQYEEAEIEYLNLLKADPKNARAIAQLGLIYQEQGREVQAYQVLSTARELDPQNLEVRLGLGFIYLSANERDKAVEESQLVLAHQPQNRRALILLAEATNLPKDLDVTLSKLGELERIGGDAVGLHLAVGTLRFRSSDYTAAETEWRNAIAKDPKCSEAHHALGNLFWMKNNLEAAEGHLKTAAELPPARSIRRVKYADFKVAAGQLDEASAELKRITDQADDYLPAWIRQAEIALMKAEHTRCHELLERVLKRDPYSFGAQLLRGRLLIAKNEPQPAVEAFEKMLRVFPKSAVAHFQLGAAHRRNNNSAKAILALKQALLLAPDYQSASEMLVQVHLEEGNVLEAIRIATSFLNHHSSSMDAHLLMADTLQIAVRTNEMKEVLKQATALQPARPEPYFRLGLISLSEGDKSAALKSFEQALEVSRSFFPALDKIIELHLAEGRTEAAEERVAGSVQAGTQTAQSHYLTAKVAVARNNLKRAESSLGRARAIDRAFAPAYILKAQLQFRDGKDTDGIETLQALLKVDGRSVPALALLATVYTKRGDFGEIGKVYEKWLEVDPRSVVALNNLAWVYSEKLDRVQEAALLAQRAIEIAPSHLEVKHTLGWIRCLQGDYSTGLDLMEQAASASRKAAELHFHLGVAHHMMGNEASARGALETALSGSNDPEIAAGVERWLQIHRFNPHGDDAPKRAALEKWLQEKPNDPVALLKLGAYFEHHGEGEKAIAFYKRVVDRHGRNTAALLGVSRVFQNQLNDTKSALEFARRAYEAAPEDATIVTHFAQLCSGARQYKRAISLLEKTATNRKLSVQESLDLTSAHFAVGRISEAEARLSAALESPNMGGKRHEMETLLRMARFLLQRDAKHGDVELAGAILQANKTSLPALAVVATALERKGAVTEARTHFEELLQLFPEFAPAKKQLALLYTRNPENWEKAYEWAEKARMEYPDDADVGKLLTIRYYRRNLSSNTNVQAIAHLDQLLESLR